VGDGVTASAWGVTYLQTQFKLELPKDGGWDSKVGVYRMYVGHDLNALGRDRDGRGRVAAGDQARRARRRFRGVSAMGISRTTLYLSALTCVVALATSEARAGARAGGTVVGTITTKEAALKPIQVTIDPNVCGSSLRNEAISVDPSGHLANVVVTATGLKAQLPADVSLNNEKCSFVPRVAVLRPNGNVKMTSKDPVLHTMHAAGADGKAYFNVSMPIPNLTITKPLDKPGVVTLSCSTHTWMRGFLFVTDELSTISATDGKFRLDNVPAGVIELRFWHEMLEAAPVKVTVREGQTVSVDVVLAK
jgi:plastocyanin